MAKNVVCIEINELYTRVAHLEQKKDKIEILSLGYDATIPNFYSNPIEQVAAEQGKVVTNLLSQLHLDQQKVSVIIPDTHSYAQLLIMPALKEEELINSIRLQADEFIPLPIDEVYIDLEIISQLPDSKILILFVASPKKLVDHISHVMTLANLEPISLENELSAVGRFVAEVYPFIKEPSLIINFGYSGSSIYFLNPPFQYFEITRTTRIGLDILYRDLKINLNMKEQQVIDALSTIGLRSGGSVNLYPIIYPIVDELIVEIQKTLMLAKDRYNASIKHIYLFNFDSQISGIHEVIQSKLNIPTEPFPLSGILLPNAITQSFAANLTSFVSVIAGHIR